MNHQTNKFSKAIGALNYDTEYDYILKHQLNRLDILFSQPHKFVYIPLIKLRGMNPPNTVAIKFDDHRLPLIVTHLAADKMFVSTSPFVPNVTEEDVISLINENPIESIKYN